MNTSCSCPGEGGCWHLIFKYFFPQDIPRRQGSPLYSRGSWAFSGRGDLVVSCWVGPARPCRCCLRPGPAWGALRWRPARCLLGPRVRVGSWGGGLAALLSAARPEVAGWARAEVTRRKGLLVTQGPGTCRRSHCTSEPCLCLLGRGGEGNWCCPVGPMPRGCPSLLEGQQ